MSFNTTILSYLNAVSKRKTKESAYFRGLYNTIEYRQTLGQVWACKEFCPKVSVLSFFHFGLFAVVAHLSMILSWDISVRVKHCFVFRQTEIIEGKKKTIYRKIQSCRSRLLSLFYKISYAPNYFPKRQTIGSALRNSTIKIPVQ